VHITLYYSILHCIILHCIVLYCIALHYIILYDIILCYIILYNLQYQLSSTISLSTTRMQKLVVNCPRKVLKILAETKVWRKMEVEGWALVKPRWEKWKDNSKLFENSTKDNILFNKSDLFYYYKRHKTVVW